MAADGFIVGQGAAYVTPSSSGLSTVTYMLPPRDGDSVGGRYIKLRDLDVFASYLDVDPLPPSPESDWLYIGRGPQRLFIRTQSLSDSLGRFQDTMTRGRILRAVSQFFGFPRERTEDVPGDTPPEIPLGCTLPISSVFLNAQYWMDKGKKVTTAMCLHQHPIIVASSRLYDGSAKVHKLVVPLCSFWRSDECLMGQPYVLSKSGPSERLLEIELTKDFRITETLSASGVPNIVHFTEVIRGRGRRIRGKDKKGLVSDFFEVGNLRSYVIKCFDVFSWECLPGQKDVLLSVAQQISQALSKINDSGFVHGDVKLENILLRRTERGISASLCDFSLAMRVDTNVYRALGTYPPPESQANMVLLEYPSKPVYSKNRVDASVDRWAFGVMLFALYHGIRSELSGLCYDKDEMTMLATREQLINVLAEDPVDDLIRALLNQDPAQRPSMSDVEQELTKIIKELPHESVFDCPIE